MGEPKNPRRGVPAEEVREVLSQTFAECSGMMRGNRQ
jgi:hypothetical protein